MAVKSVCLVALGNPGRQYANTRHNVGFLAADQLIQLHGLAPIKSKFGAEAWRGDLGGVEITLIKPMQYMNMSGAPTLSWMTQLLLSPQRLIVMHDDIELPFGSSRTKLGGGSAGHNGLRSITQALGNNYHRIRIGVGRPTDGQDVASYVLSAFTADELAKLPSLYDAVSTHALQLVEMLAIDM